MKISRSQYVSLAAQYIMDALYVVARIIIIYGSSIHLCVCLGTCACVLVCMCVCTCVHMCMYDCVCVRVCVHVCMCVRCFADLFLVCIPAPSSWREEAEGGVGKSVCLWHGIQPFPTTNDSILQA